MGNTCCKSNNEKEVEEYYYRIFDSMFVHKEEDIHYITDPLTNEKLYKIFINGDYVRIYKESSDEHFDNFVNAYKYNRKIGNIAHKKSKLFELSNRNYLFIYDKIYKLDIKDYLQDFYFTRRNNIEYILVIGINNIYLLCEMVYFDRNKIKELNLDPRNVDEYVYNIYSLYYLNKESVKRVSFRVIE